MKMDNNFQFEQVMEPKPYWTGELVEEFFTWLNGRTPPNTDVTERTRWYNEKKLEFLESRLPSPQQLLLG